ncbi:MAG: 1,4-dihydroxy-2-naphthoate polyprenyltransferase [Cytophagales bacterium]|nr:1,4-dihydroxy-2-naphthoate polyprenyltransferase [Cytophagales bacterium]MDW8383926.1 1,4-dihydroxy-2-naphthoate polyprenyltransferase [Flammeovirgaceae bacterium]
MQIQYWIKALRLRTLPLAVASIGMGSFLAASRGLFEVSILIWATLTSICLQILSNLANDYGDSIHGVDSSERIGPQRMVQSGYISASAMKKALFVMTFFSLACGIMLLKTAFYPNNMTEFWIFFGIGLLALLAAIAYTNGKRPYGYEGYGDISVLIFFGYVAVGGTFFLHTKTWDWLVLLPATSSGVLAVGVLNLNNMRDIESDKAAGKYSIPVRIGYEKALIYHGLLCRIALICSLLYVVQLPNPQWYQYLFAIPIGFLLYRHLRAIGLQPPHKLDSHLKELVFISLLFTIFFGICIIVY